MGGKTSSSAKNRYNAKAYDQIPLRVKKGLKDEIREAAEKSNESVNGFINRIIQQELEKSKK